MLKMIRTSQARLGMYVQSFEGSWLAHPFWKTKFLLSDPADLKALQGSGLDGIWIDISKGADVEAAAPAPAAAVAAAAPRPARSAAGPRSLEPRALSDELRHATDVMNRSVDTVNSIFGEARMGRAVDTEQCLPVVDEVVGSVARNRSALLSLVRLKTKDNYTYMHSVAVCTLMVALARQMGMAEDAVREAGIGGLLHDVGKMLVPVEVLNKPGALSDAEFDLVRLHPQRGHDALVEGGNAPAAALEVCLRHHEKMDGSGYPGRLAGDQISLLARMGAVCDVYDAITSTRPYKSAWDPAGSIHRMAQWKGHFDPAVFQAFVKSVGIYPVGTLVKLQSQRLAVVVDQNQASLVTPLVRVFFSARSRQPVPVELVDLSRPDMADRILGRENPRDWGFTDLDRFWRSPNL
ncbi:HD-GYP domain-containing protein [Pelomonas sp. KK5]|uniref:HD-GYP domain-containing protein n=1 Tax=Pelomonas sp. KK5 TaxID=1855730 RepID=UPI00097BB9A4|nr:HD-GYP domain-containing protein [Pelomonas sp. KK5]